MGMCPAKDTMFNESRGALATVCAKRKQQGNRGIRYFSPGNIAN